MGYDTTETVFAIPKSDITTVADTVHAIFLEHHFHIAYQSEHVWLEDIDTDDGEEYVFEGISIDLASPEDAEAAFARLRKHRTGGFLTYRGKAAVYAPDRPQYAPWGILTSFGSLDNQTIEYVEFSIPVGVLHNYAPALNAVMNLAYAQLGGLGAARYTEDHIAETAAELAEHIIAGTLGSVEKPVEVVFPLT